MSVGFRFSACGIVGMLLAACSPCRYSSTATHDSLRIETAVRIERFPDTVFVEVPVEIVRQTIRDTISHLESAFARSDARIAPDGSLFHSLENKAQKWPVKVETKIVRQDSIVFRDRLAERIVEVPQKPTRWQSFRLHGFWVLLAAWAIACRKRIRAIFGFFS